MVEERAAAEVVAGLDDQVVYLVTRRVGVALEPPVQRCCDGLPATTCCRRQQRKAEHLVVVLLQGALIAFFVALPAVGVVGLLFLGVWIYMLWLRREVARRMAEGRLPSQQE